MYDSVQSMYCYPGTDVLINKADFHTQKELDEFISERPYGISSNT